jgi:murein DD-endopeptidase MepM/ murein hydrolase activator NlpD
MADQSKTSLDLSKLTAGELAELGKKLDAAKAETEPRGPKQVDLDVYIQGLTEAQGLTPGATVGVTEASSEMELIPFPFVSSSTVQALGAKVRVFIMGVEVSDYVDSATWQGNAATSDLNCNATIHLKCPHDLLTITPQNINPSPAAGTVNWVISSDPMYSERVKRDIYDYKRLQNYFEQTTNVPRWNLASNSCIFHHADTVRIFVRLPWADKDAWLPVFTGYLQSPQLSRQTTGQDDIVLSCDTLAARLAKARVFNQMNAETLNPKSSSSRLPSNEEFMGITNIDVVDTSLMFSDAFGSSANALLDTSLEGVLRFVFYGDLSKSTKLFKDDAELKREEIFAAYFNKMDALKAIKGKSSALGVPPAKYADQIDQLTKETDALFKQIQADPVAKSSIVDGKVQDTTYIASSLRGRRALGFLDPQLFVTDFAFPVTGKIVKATPEATVPKTSTATTEAPATVYDKDLPVNITLPELPITTGYGVIDGSHKNPHMALDIPVKNESIIAPINGRVLEVGYDTRPGVKEGKGNFVFFLGEDGYVHEFLHLASVAAIKFGDQVTKGAELGISGNTGHSVGDGGGYHLHWAVWKWTQETPNWSGAALKGIRQASQPIDPIRWLGSDSVLGTTNRVAQQKTTLPQNIDKSTINWETEIALFEQWKKNCLVGWANGVPDTQAPFATDASVFNNTECYKLARERNRAYLTTDEVTVIGRNSGFLGQYSPHGQNVAVVLRGPKQGWGYNYGFTDDFQIQGASFEVNTQTRAQILIEILGKVDYYWWVSGNGDIIFDFPNYEMVPEHYGKHFKEEYRLSGLGVNDTMTEDLTTVKSTYIFRGALGGPQSAKSGDMALGRIFPAIFKIPSIAARNGIEVDDVYWPYVTSQTQLKILGALHIRKAIANSFKYSVSGLPPLLYVIPNTAVYLGDIDAYALVQGTSFGYSARGTISCSLDFTAIRQKLTSEQLYLKFQSKALSDPLITVTSQTLDSSLEKWKLDSADQLAKNNSEMLLNDIQRVSAQYGYIFGTGDLLIDYTKTYSQNVRSTDSWTVNSFDDGSAYVTGEQGNAVVFKDEPGKQRLISTPETDPAGITKPEVSTGMFQTPKEPSKEQTQALSDALDENEVEKETITPAILAHGNVTTNLQDRWTAPDFTSLKDLLTKGVGYLNLTTKVLGQLDKTIGSLGQIGDRLGAISNASFDAVASMSAAGKNLQQVTARSRVVDPRMDPYFSSLCAAAIAKQSLQHINKTQTRPLSAAEVNPDIFAYALHLGPQDPAYLALLAEADIKDLSEGNSARMGRYLQNKLWKMGGYTQKDLNYMDALQNMKKQAAKRGLHS